MVVYIRGLIRYARVANVNLNTSRSRSSVAKRKLLNRGIKSAGQKSENSRGR